MDYQRFEKKLFSISSDDDFNALSLDVFKFQYLNNPVFGNFCKALGKSPETVSHYTQIPFLPAEFFKTHPIIAGGRKAEIIFTSSGTTGTDTSKHYVVEPELYRKSFVKAFELFYGHLSNYHILALLPGYLERKGSSLIYMVQELIRLSESEHSGFFLKKTNTLTDKIKMLNDRRILLLGVSFALLDLAETTSLHNPNLIVMETGGMKGRRREPVRDELHTMLCQSFNVNTIHSEYGMTELLSQAYSTANGVFYTPSWMKVLIRETNDPLSINYRNGITGGINIIDLANLFSCSFLATQDLGKLHPRNGFEVTGRFDNSDIRGCNLLVE